MQPGEIIDGKFRIDRPLGEGGMGIVLAVTHVKLGKQYAIKVVKSSALAIPGVADRFLREARAASQLKSEHVGAVTDVGELPTGEPYMVMEMLDGEDLGAVIERGPLRTDIAVDYVLQACEALAEAHALGMVHRDIKPANLFLTERRNGSRLVKVLDFGIATAGRGEVSGLTETHSVMGSPQYMSPEQLRSAKIVDARSDLWALGVTLYELLSGRQPFEGTTFTALAIKIATEPHQPLTGVPPELAAIIDRCLAKDPAHRHADIGALAQALAPFTRDARRSVDQIARVLKPFAAATLPADPSPSLTDRDVAFRAEDIETTPERPQLRTTTTLGGSAASFAGAPVTKRSSSRAIWLAGIVAIAIGGVVTFAIVNRDDQASAPPLTASAESSPAPVATPIPAPAAATTRVRIATVPADAEVRIDDTVVANPFAGSFPRGDVRHHVQVRAPGHQAKSQWITFADDRDLDIALDKEPTPAVVVKPKLKQPPVVTKVLEKPLPETTPTHAADSGSSTPTAPADPKKPTYKGTKGEISTKYPDQ